MENLDYKKVFKSLVKWTENYIKENGIKSMFLGISGGIDSTVVAYIARVVSSRTKIPLIGRSLTIKNKKSEVNTAKLVGESFCTDFEEIYMGNFYRNYLIDTYLEEYSKKDDSLGSRNIFTLTTEEIEDLNPFRNKISNGNIMARLRMNYLYDLAGRNKGLVLDTDNLTEHYLGFWTIHGDEGDLGPIGNLWKTEVYGLANWILDSTKNGIYSSDLNTTIRISKEIEALESSIALIPTDGNGISSSDLEQIGGKDYFEVDKILIPIVLESDPDSEELAMKYIDDTIIGTMGFDRETVYKIYNRYKNSEFKRLTSRTIKVPLNRLECSIL